MRRGTLSLLFFIILLTIGASYVVFWPNAVRDGKPFYGQLDKNDTQSYLNIPNPFYIHEGLDLQGGLRVLLVPTDPKVQMSDVENARTQLEKRINGGLGVNEPSIRTQTINNVPSISVELPGLTQNQQEAANSLLKTGTLEFWDTGSNGYLQADADFTPSDYASANGGTAPIFKGADLDSNSLQAGQNSSGSGYVIQFAMQGAAMEKLSTFTQQHVGDYLTITLDRKVITSAAIRGQLPGKGEIEGNFTLNEAQAVVNVLKYGSLPIDLQIQSQESVSATLGQDSINRSIMAGLIGLGIVILFMLLYYRLPGFLADVALILYTIISLALFKLIGVTLTLAGIAGFVLSIGMAVDANVLIFERVKEELRAGRLLSSAIDIGWQRAWPSIRDSNFSTLITCGVLYFFGNNFGATIIVGFATTLFLGVVVSMFTAITVTRTFLNLLVPTGVINHPALFGLPAKALAKPKLAQREGTV